MHLQAAEGRKVSERGELLELKMSPLKVAEGLRHCKGLAFLDSARAGLGAISIVATEPEFVLKDTNWSRLEEEVANRRDVIAIGWISYEMEICFGFYPHCLIYDHDLGTWRGSSTLADKIQSKMDEAPSPPLVFSSTVNCKTYGAQVIRAQELIAAGDIYQVNLTYPFSARWKGNGFHLFRSLRETSPAPFSAYLNVAGVELISSSPELFLKMHGREIVTRPIKGTRPRYADPQQDARSSNELLTSAKERAELIMITDLERNDLGKICDFGSVRVTELLKLEEFSQIFHLTSTIQGSLKEDVSHVAALKSCFPGGSITGAPKTRAREIIRGIEQQPRGIYTGAMGYFGQNGVSQFAVTIRTVAKQGEEVSFSVGAGIVADSDPAMEYQETLDKAAGILLAAKRLTSQSEQNGDPEEQIDKN